MYCVWRAYSVRRRHRICCAESKAAQSSRNLNTRLVHECSRGEGCSPRGPSDAAAQLAPTCRLRPLPFGMPVVQMCGPARGSPSTCSPPQRLHPPNSISIDSPKGPPSKSNATAVVIYAVMCPGDVWASSVRYLYHALTPRSSQAIQVGGARSLSRANPLGRCTPRAQRRARPAT